MTEADEPPPPLWQRLAWFIGFWLAGVGVVTIVGLVIRWWLGMG